MLGYGDGIIIGSTDGELLGYTLGVADRNTLGVDEGTDLGSPYDSFDGCNEVKPVGLLSGKSLVSDDRAVLGR